MKIIIDIGHGGTKITSGRKITDYGAVNASTGLTEYMWNKDYVERYIIPEFIKNNIKYQVVPRKVGVTGLVNDLNKAADKEDIILSFHLNSSGSSTSTGTETLYWHTSMKGKRLSTIIQEKLTSVLELRDRGIKIRRKPVDKEDEKNQRGWTMFRDTKVPFIMMESFFLNNDKDLQRGNLKRAEMAKAVTEAVIEYIKN